MTACIPLHYHLINQSNSTSAVGRGGLGRCMGGRIGIPGFEGGRIKGGRPCPVEGNAVVSVVIGEGRTGR